MIRVSFYLLNPNAQESSHLYVSITKKGDRIRFWTGHALLTAYCNKRKTKGRQQLVKRNTPFYFEYNDLLNEIRDKLHKISYQLHKESSNFGLEEIREEFEILEGRKSNEKSFLKLYDEFVEKEQSAWTFGTLKHYNTLRNHLMTAESEIDSIILNRFDNGTWNQIRDKYFVEFKGLGNNTTNSNLRKLKNFLSYFEKQVGLPEGFERDGLKFLKEIEPFKIALREDEIRELMSLDLSNESSLSKVRDLFILEVLTGQRFSDLPKLLNRKNITDSNIQIIQGKTKEKVFIPLHPDLKVHLHYILDLYKDNIPHLSNQKFNDYIKKVCKKAGIDRKHSWSILVGKEQVSKSASRYDLVSSHTGRRTFCTLALKNKIPAEIIMKVTGHRKYEQFKEYVRVDDMDIGEAFNEINLIR